MFRVDVKPSQGFGAIPNDLRRAGGGLRGRLTAQLKQPTKGIYDAVRREVLTGSMAARRVPGARKRFPAGPGAGNHVRKPALSGLNWKVSTAGSGARADVTWNPQQINPRVRPLFPYLVGQKSRLRHPVMGNRSTWVGQAMPNAWAPTKRLAPLAQRAAGKALDETAQIIAGKK